MQNGRIKAQQLMASSIWDKNTFPTNGRLHLRRRGSQVGAWIARQNNRYQWFQTDFGRAMRMVKFAMQGRQDYAQWVTSVYLSSGVDGANFAEYKVNSARKVLLVIRCEKTRDWRLLAFRNSDLAIQISSVYKCGDQTPRGLFAITNKCNEAGKISLQLQPDCSD